MTTLPGLPSFKYNRESVERALTHHFGEGGPTGWTADGKGGYVLSTGRGIVRLRTLREAALVVIACADKERRLERAARKETS